MKHLITITAVLLATSSVSFASDRRGDDQFSHRYNTASQKMHQKHDNGRHVKIPERRIAPGYHAKHGHHLSKHQLRRLPKLHYGYRYRIVDGHVVTVDEALKIIAVIGLVSVILG